MVEKKKPVTRPSRLIHEDEPEAEYPTPPETQIGVPLPVASLYGCGPSAPLADRKAAAATTERDRLELKKKQK